MSDTIIKDLFHFLDASVTPFHGAAEASVILESSGYKKLDESLSWNLEPQTGYYVVRNGSSLIAFHTGELRPSDEGFRLIAAHTDSPGFRLKGDTLSLQSGVLKAGLEVLGGPILSTWLDRNLTIAGRLIVRTSSGLESRLYKKEGASCLIPNPPIHLNRELNKGFDYNPQTHLSLLLGEPVKEGSESLYSLIAGEEGIAADSILEADLLVCDTMGAERAGWQGSYFTSGRIDNLGMCHAALTALKEAGKSKAVSVAALFDNEEMGSLTPHGADSSFLEQILERIVLASGGSREDFLRSGRSSFMISADQAHGLHPNFTHLYDENAVPLLNKGPVVKFNANWSYASTGETAAEFRELCSRAGVSCQTYLNRSDVRGGRSLGPIAAARLGIPAVDVGNPLWSMHSIRETAGIQDHLDMIKVFKAHFNNTDNS